MLFTIVLSGLESEGDGYSLALTVGAIFGFSGIILGLGHYFGHAFLQKSRHFLAWPSGFIGLVTVLILVAAAISEVIGIHSIFGAFLVGVALRQGLDQGNRTVQEVIHQFAVSFFAPLYFVSVGLKVNFVDNFDLPLVILVLLVACIGKVLGAGFGAWLGRRPPREAWAIGFAMNARGAMEMILAAVALEYGLIDQRVFVALVIMALITSMISGPALQRLLGKPGQTVAVVETVYLPE
jgi:Kef-type K+ transport system membrane component KefB